MGKVLQQLAFTWQMWHFQIEIINALFFIHDRIGGSDTFDSLFWPITALILYAGSHFVAHFRLPELLKWVFNSTWYEFHNGETARVKR